VPDGWSVACTLDSDHSAEHVARELDAYAPLVTPGHYLVVQDTYLGLYLDGDYAGGPLGAVEAFLTEHPEFEIDMHPQRWLITQNPFGWLKRKP
jgi:cephalosporin hydroxylase